MSDLIDRQAAIDYIKRALPDWSEDKEVAIDCLSNLPPASLYAQTEQRWIPCSERFPENSEEVLTTYIVNGNKNNRYTETATYYDGDEGYWSSPWDEYRVAGTRIEVIAWMPLPAVYREEGCDEPRDQTDINRKGE